jgi:hypothetical protein
MERALVVIFQEEWQRSTAGATVPPHPPADLDQLRLHRPQRDLKLFVFANCWHHRFTVLDRNSVV